MRFKSKYFLWFCLAIMAGFLFIGIFFPETLLKWLRHPEYYNHAKFIHVLSVTLFFSNAVIGAIWETRSMLTKRMEIVRYTYQTVVWLDATFTAPLIILAVLSGIMLGTVLGGVWNIGWISLAFTFFFISGAVWVLADIPTQYKINRIFNEIPDATGECPPRLMRLLWLRAVISLLGILPLIAAFYLMVHKPDIPSVAKWHGDAKIHTTSASPKK